MCTEDVAAAEPLAGVLASVVAGRSTQRGKMPYQAAPALACPVLYRAAAMQHNANVLYARRGQTETSRNDMRHYFEYSSQGIEVLEDGLKEISFGEYLIEKGVIDRFQLFQALQMQDRLPGVRLGEAAAALGFAPIKQIEKLYAAFSGVDSVTVD